ncbi:DNA polymerase III subunit beta [Mycoplasma sp. 005V]|uniref:DNA polymerase III subunit beta n=1 Tax=unclassified Mycoplasma TaxID=2683645 RepID=UPI003A853A6D
MKFTISKPKIDRLVEFLSTYIDSNDTFIPFRCVYMSIDSENLTLIGASPTLAARKIVPIDNKEITVERSGNFYLSANLLRNIIKKFDKEITFEERAGVVDIYEGTTLFTLTKLNAGVYPKLDFEDTENKVSVKSHIFEKVISDVSTSTSSSNDRLNSLIYKCINISAKNSAQLRFLATDSYRLSTEVIQIDKPVTVDLTIDARNLKKLITKDAPENVELFFDSNKIGISYENTVIWTSLYKSNYIDVSSLFQVKYTRNFKIEREELLKTLNKALFYQTEKDKKMEFHFDYNSLKVVYEVPEIGTANAVSDALQIVEGKDIDIDFNYTYVKDAVSALDSGMLNIFISQNEDKILFISENDPNHIQLITPMRKFYNK